jgi:predicted deacylase
MNRFYPGKMDGTQTDRASYLITKQVVEQCDHLIDLHGGDLGREPAAVQLLDEDRKRKAGSDLARDGPGFRARSHNHLSRAAERSAGVALPGKHCDHSRQTINHCRSRSCGTVETDDLNALVNGCLNVMRYLKMLPGTALMVEHPVWFEKVATLASEQTGIFYPSVKRGTYVEQGTKVGYVTD